MFDEIGIVIMNLASCHEGVDASEVKDMSLSLSIRRNVN